MDSLNFQPIGTIKTCYQEKFGIPRQPGLVTASKSQLVLDNMFDKESVRGLEGFSHVWVQFVFHQTEQQGWKSLVRPPRLGGNAKVGVFASRSSFRPNPIGLSVVELLDIEIKKSTVILHLLGCDLLNNTPILDIKPYLPYVDAIPEALGGFAQQKPQAVLDVVFSDEAKKQCEQANLRLGEDVVLLIEQVLRLDPRPSYQKPSYQKPSQNLDRIYRMKLYDFDLRWQYCENNRINVIAIDD